MSVNILFYSNNCDSSRTLISLMQKENLMRFFYTMCTDNNPCVPVQISVTPTIIIKGVPTPYVASDAFTWLAKIKQWKLSVIRNNVALAQQKYLQQMSNNLGGASNGEDPLMGFSQTEMNGLSDIFSFFSGDISKESDGALPQSYVLYDNIGKELINTLPLEDGTYKIKKDGRHKPSATKQKELCAKLQKERANQDEMYRGAMTKFKDQYNK